jgi:hypothetical protein
MDDSVIQDLSAGSMLILETICYIPLWDSFTGEMSQGLDKLSILEKTKTTALLTTHEDSSAAACEGTSLIQLANCQP